MDIKLAVKNFLLIGRNCLISLAGGIVALFLYSFITYFFNIKIEALNIGLYIIFVATVFAAAFLSGRGAEKKGYLSGILSALIMLLMFLLVNIVFNDKFMLLSFGKKSIFPLIAGLFGGTAGINSRDRNKKRFSKHK